MKYVAALALLALTAPTDERAWTAHVSVRFVTEGDAHRAEVETALEWNGGRGSWPDTVELRMYPGWGGFVRGIQIADDKTDLHVPKDGEVRYDYTVPLEYDPEALSGYDETPHRLADAVLWTGRALFLLPTDADVRVVFEPSKSERVSTSLTPDEDAQEDHAYRADTALELQDTYLVVGTHEERTLDVVDTTFVLAVDGRLAEASDFIEAATREFVEAATETVGGPPPPRCLVALTWAETEGGGSVYGHDAHVLTGEPPTSDGPKGWRRSLCHELFHLWNPKRIGFDSREMWFSEGFTDYYSNRVLFTTEVLSPAEYLRIVRGWTSDYLSTTPGKGLREGGKLDAKERALIYQGGALAALCIDIELRKGSKNKRALDDVMIALYEQCAEVDFDEIPIDALERLLKKLGGRDLGKFLERHVEGSERLPLEAAFAAAGLVLEQETLLVPERSALMTLMRSNGLTATPDGVVINRTDTGKLKADDLLIELAGEPVLDFGDVLWALAKSEPGDEVNAVVIRKSKKVEVAFRIGGQGEEIPRAERERIRLVPDPEAKKAARSIRAVLFE